MECEQAGWHSCADLEDSLGINLSVDFWKVLEQSNAKREREDEASLTGFQPRKSTIFTMKPCVQVQSAARFLALAVVVTCYCMFLGEIKLL